MHDRDEAYQQQLHESRRRFLKQSLVLGAGLLLPPALSTAAKGSPAAVVLPPVSDPQLGLPFSWQPSVSLKDAVYNPATGNVLFSHPVIQGDVLDLFFYHNSKSSSTGGALGNKWSHTYSMKIVTGTGTATYYAADGAKYQFSGSGPTYTAPVGFYRTLVKNSDNTWDLFKRDADKYYHFLSDGRLDSVRRSSDGGVIVQCNYNGSSQLVEVESGTGSIFLGYTGSVVTSITDPGARVHTLVYVSGQLREHWYPTSGGVTPKTLFAYDSSGILNLLTDPTSQAWGFTYSSVGALTGTSVPGGSISTYTNNTAIQTQTVGIDEGTPNPVPEVQPWPIDVVSSANYTDPTGTVSYGFDSAGRLVAMQGANAERSVFGYDSQNRLTSKQLASGGTWSWTYDSVGRPLTEVHPNGETKAYTRDTSGRVTSISRGGTTDTTYGYNTAGRLTSVTPAGYPSLTISYDTSGRMSGLTGNGITELIEYHANGKVKRVQNALGNYHSYTWSGDLIAQETTARGRVKILQRDGWGRHVGTTFPTTGNTAEAWTYNALGYVDSGSTAAGSYTIVRNADGQVTSATRPEGTVTGGYTDGRPTYVEDTAGRRHTFTWNANDCISAVAINDGTGTLQYTYNSRNQILTCTYPNGIRTEFGYDTTGAITSVIHRVVSTNAVIASYTATYHATTKLLTQIAESPSGATTSYTYDAYRRITVEERLVDRPYRSEYTYSTTGKLATVKRWNNGVLVHNGTYTYNTADLLTSVSDAVTSTTETYTWHADQTLATFSGPGYTRLLDYDEFRRLKTISKQIGSGTPTLLYEYAYDLDDVLAWFKDYTAGTITSYSLGVGMLSGDVLIAKQKPISGSTWTEIARYVYGIDHLAGISGTFHFNGFNVGPSLATNASGTTTGTCVLDSTGIFRHGTGVFATSGQLPSRLVHEGLTIRLPSASVAIPERFLSIA